MLNPAYERVALPDGPFLVRRTFNEFLPTVVNPAHATLTLVAIVSAMAMAVILIRTAYSRQLMRLQLTFLVGNAAGISLVGLTGKLVPDFTLAGMMPQTDTLPFGTFDYHNNWTGFAIPVLAVALGLIETRLTRKVSSEEPRRLPIGLVIMVGLIVAGLILSSSRSGLIMMTILTGVVGIRLARHLKRSGASGSSLSRHLKPNALYLVIFLCAVGAILFAGRGILKSRWDYTRMQVEMIAEGDRLEPRIFLARDTASMAMSRPVLGWGHGSWVYLFPAFAGPEFWVRIGSEMRSFSHAHNDWLQLWAENGAVGVLAVLIVPAWLLWRLRRTGHANPITFWAFLGVGLVGLLACWDYPMGHPANMFQVAILFAAGTAYAVLEKRARRVKR
ncbi:MAG: hypothetical protein DRP71_16580 [Verrucomicrobia bacterium]|nr:MAG: hypothetical protein DRP71_16580 [Verrucomicrobiota bacterium]